MPHPISGIRSTDAFFIFICIRRSFHPCYRAEAFYKRERGFQRPKSPKPANLFRRNFYGHNVYKSGGRFYRTGRTPGKKSPRFSVYGGRNATFERRVGGEIGLAQIFFPPREFSHDFGKCFFKMSEIDSSVCYTVTETGKRHSGGITRGAPRVPAPVHTAKA